jgi:hypothetical protein
LGLHHFFLHCRHTWQKNGCSIAYLPAPNFCPCMTYPDFAARWRNFGGNRRPSYGRFCKTSATC